MSYQVLARKWRPQVFSDLIGQQPIVTALRNALAEGRVAQAYLFSGIRGVGKTTAARLLAKALNCEQGPNPEPCNECSVCREITRGGDLDVIEVDAATYSKVEQVRELTESLRYGPARDRYKVVVLDEIHRLSRQAFDALLKIVEEPPEHLVFIFATTEIEAVPATILSRCQEFHFRRVPAERLALHLRQIAKSEEISCSDTALRLIARAGEGSVRDAVGLLDQLATFGGGAISDEEAVRLLGGLDLELFRECLAAILDGRCIEVIQTVRQIEDEGWDPRNVFGQFLSYCRDALHLSLGGDAGCVDLPREEAEALAGVAGAAGYENLLRLTQQLLASEVTVNRSEAGALALEIAWLRAAELPKLTRVEELLAGGMAGGPVGKSQPVPGGAAAARRPSAPAGASTGPASEEAASPPQPPPGSALGSPAEAASPGDVGGFLELVARRKPPLAARLEGLKLHFENGRLGIVAPPEVVNALQRAGNQQVLDECAQATWGAEATCLLVPAASRPAAAAPEPEGKSSAMEDVGSDTAVQAVLDLFGGKVDAVEPTQVARED